MFYAFPSHGTMGEVCQEGMTLREYYAAAALTGLLASGKYLPTEPQLAVDAFLAADNMMTECSK